MRCPFCGHEDTQVKDSRSSEDGSSIRRRRMCPECESRFTTFERIQIREIMVIKKDGRRKPFDRDKLARSMHLALRKRPVKEEQVEQAVNNLVRQFESSGETELTSDQIGLAVMKSLSEIDPVAYVRFASVYRQFREAKDFEDFVTNLNTPKTAS